MPARFAFLPSFVCLIGLTMPAASGEAPSAIAPERTDRYGDPLPPGVVARLGTERLNLNGGVFLAFSPDGRRLAVHNGNDRLHIWEVATGKELLRLKTPAFGGYGTWMTPLLFSPDGKVLALAGPAERDRSGNHKATVRVWDTATGKELHLFANLPSQVIRLAFSPDGRYLFAAGGISPRRWDLVRGGAPKKYGDFRSAGFLALSRDGKTLTAGTSDEQDRRKHIFARWDVATGKEMGRHTFSTAEGWAGSLSPEGSVFAAPDIEGKNILLFDPLTGEEPRRARESDYPACISFSADGATMTCSSKDGIIRIWETSTGKLRTRFQAMSTHVTCTALSADGKLLALSGEADFAVHLWDVAAGRELHSFVGHRSNPLSVAFLKDGKEIVTVSRDYSHSSPIVTWTDWSLRRWDAATGAELAVTRPNPKGSVCYTVFSPDKRLLATVIHDGTLRIWDVLAGKELRSWKVPIRESTTIWGDGKGGKIVLKTPDPAIGEPSFTPDGKALLATHGAKILRWQVASGKELPAIEVEGFSRQIFLRCLLSPDGRTLLVWSTEGAHPQVMLLEAAGGKMPYRLEGIQTMFTKPAFSSDGRTIAVCDSGVVLLWEVASGRPRGRLTVPRSTRSVTFSPDGRFLAVGGHGESWLSLWDLAAGQVVGHLHSNCGQVESLAFSPDGSRLAVAGFFSTALVCDVAELCGKKNIREVAKVALPSVEELEGLWAELSGGDGARAYRAIRRLGLTGSRGATFLKARLKGDKPPDERRITRLIVDLDDDKFATREKASVELGKLGARAESALRRALRGEVSAEARARIKRLLEPLDAARGPLPSAELVQLRAVEALEAIGSKEARRALAELADGPMDASLTHEAKASLTRLRSRQIKP